jgi:serine/threonine protein kinase
MSALVGKTIGNRFHVNAFLGKGGMAEVYKVWDQSRLVTLAIKVLNPTLARDSVFLEHFREEARALARLQHPKIIRFYSLERDGDIAFIVMDYAEGNTLRDEIQARRILPPQRILQIMRDICAALNYAHETGYVHCDIKPANIILDKNGSALLSDFGIARATGSASNANSRSGTAGYMSPEQILGETPTRASDIYALGVLLFEMLTGTRPFLGQAAQTSGSTAERVRWEQLNLSAPSPRKYNPSISPELEGIILRCLDRNASRRFPNVQSLLAALEPLLLRGMVYDNAVTATIQKKYTEKKTRDISAPTGSRLINKGLLWLLLTIPVVAILAFFAAGGNGKHQPSVQATSTSYRFLTNVPTPVTVYAPPPIMIRAYDPNTDQNLECVSCLVPGWTDPKVPGSYHWNVSYSANTPIRIALGWCASDKQTLDSNWSNLDFGLMIDGVSINLNDLSFRSDNNCYGYWGVLTGWSIGQHEYTQTLHFSRTLNDGSSTYQAGVYIENFTINVR